MMTDQISLSEFSTEDLKLEIGRRESLRRTLVEKDKKSGLILSPDMLLYEVPNVLSRGRIIDPKTVEVEGVEITLSNNIITMKDGTKFWHDGYPPILFRYNGKEYMRNNTECLASDFPLRSVLTAIKMM